MIGDTFMWFPDAPDIITGETTDEWFARRNAFEISTYKFNATNADEDKKSKQGLKFGSFTITKPVDLASVPLYQACSEGRMFPSVMMATRKAGGAQFVYLQFLFRKVWVTGIEWSGGGGEKAPEETVTLSFKAMGVQYVAQT